MALHKDVRTNREEPKQLPVSACAYPVSIFYFSKLVKSLGSLFFRLIVRAGLPFGVLLPFLLWCLWVSRFLFVLVPFPVVIGLTNSPIYDSHFPLPVRVAPCIGHLTCSDFGIFSYISFLGAIVPIYLS